MRNIKYTIASLTLLLATAGVSAQEAATPQSIERKKIESLWFSNTDNAAGAQIDNMSYFSRLDINYNKTKGDFKRAQSGADNDGYGFSTDGGGNFESLGGVFLWGYFDFKRDKVRDAEFNASLIDPLRGMPYYLADHNKSSWINQDYSLGVKAATPELWDHVIFGMGLDYQNAQGAKQIDPRPNVLLSKFTITPSVVYTLGQHAIGADFSYYSRREDGTANNSVSFVTQPVWEVVAPGFFSTGDIGGGLSGLRAYNANSLGGGLQYSFGNDDVKVLLSGNYTYTVEDVNNNYTTPKIIGTTKENLWTGKLNVIWSMDQSNSLIFKGEYYNRSIDGIEYIQVFDNKFEVAQWTVISKNIRSNYSTARTGFTLDYMNKDDGDSYRWIAGADLQFEKLTDIYYIPTSEQNVKNMRFGLHLKKNFIFGENSILVAARGTYNHNLDSDRTYDGINASSKIYTDMVLHDYDYLRNKYVSAGGELSYTRRGLFGGRSAIYATAEADYVKPLDCTAEYDFSHRMYLTFKVGLAF